MYTLGIDIGSTTSKAVILENGKKIVATSLCRWEPVLSAPQGP